MAGETQADAGQLGKDERLLCDFQQIPCPLWASTSLLMKEESVSGSGVSTLALYFSAV